MDQEIRWLIRYNEVKEFIEREHGNLQNINWKSMIC